MAVDARSNTVRFGPFELDRRNGELRRKGTRIRLEGQPIKILVLLLDRPGELVTQEEVRRKLWPDGTVVEYEHSIKTALRKLRHALGDGAEAPLYIETLPRRGYRFIASVDAAEPTEPPAAEPSGESTSSSPLPANGSTTGRRARAWLWAAVVAMFMVGLGWGIYRSLRHAPALTEKDTLVVSDFVNTTGDPVFDGALRQGLTVQLEESPFLSLVSEARIQKTFPLMGQSSELSLTPKIARDLCQRLGSVAVINGSIARLGRQYVLGLKAVECRTGDSLAEEQETADSKEQVLKALAQAATRLRSKLGESMNSLQRFDTPVEQATTPSLEALQAYSMGMKLLIGKSDFNAALQMFQRAIDLDPKFAAAYSGLVLTYINLAETDLASKAGQKAYDLRAGVSEPEKFLIEANYYQSVSGDLEKARNACQVWSQIYPRDHRPRGFGIAIYSGLGQYERALDEARVNLSLDPTSALGYGGLALSYLNLGRFNEAQATAAEALAKNVDSPLLRDSLYELAFLENDHSEMAQQVAWASGKPGAEDLILAMEAHTAVFTGQAGKAVDFFRRAVASAQRADEKETAALYQADAAQWEAFFGFAAEAREHAHAALSGWKGRDVEYGAALGLALANIARGEQTGIANLADDLAKRFPDDTLVRLNYLPTLRAQIALNRDQPLQAIEVLQASVPYELGTPGAYGFPQALLPVYVRGEAYLAAHRGPEAVAEFQKVLNHRGIVFNEPIGAMAHLELARAYGIQAAEASDDSRTQLRANARSAYEDFLKLWKEADPNIPLLTQARAEHDRLK
jgi:DNA-binding winged helix-turn-helix (wHTH) protein/tetratricopeptide (TPR) repeat protein